jgi:hypothetical protein
MSRLERIGKGVAIAAVGLFGINLIPHFKPKISHKIYKYENAEVPEQLVEHVKKIARAMVSPSYSTTCPLEVTPSSSC